MNTKEIRVVFMGTPSFAVPILKSLIDGYNVVLVVCQPDRKKNRKGEIEYPDTKIVAMDNNIPIFQPVRLRENYQEIIDYIASCYGGTPDELTPNDLSVVIEEYEYLQNGGNLLDGVLLGRFPMFK